MYGGSVLVGGMGECEAGLWERGVWDGFVGE